MPKVSQYGIQAIGDCTMGITTKNWKNKKGTSDRVCTCGSWKNHWVTQSGKQWPSSCSVAECNTTPVLGAHVINANVDGEKIVPMCDSCNKLAMEFDLKGGISLISANQSESCG